MDHFTPPFCPNPRCPDHHPRPGSPYQRYRSWGSYATRAFGPVPRYRCASCGRTFSAQTFSVDYFAKKLIDYDAVARRLSSCESLSAIGRAIHASTDSVSNRIARAARQAIAFSSRLKPLRMPIEDLVADGFESFCVSQYFPNNIHYLVGMRSQFVYAADHVTLRRKGRMTEAQKKRRAVLDQLYKSPPRALERSFRHIVDESLRVLSDGGREAIYLWTDEKKEYARAIKDAPCASALAAVERFVHRTVSSRAARTINNPLLAVNYLDRELRKDLHEHVRETTCFGRNVNRQMERSTLYCHWHNFRKPHRARGEGRSHAEVAGQDVRLIARLSPGLWKERAWLSDLDVTVEEKETWLRLRKTPLGKETDYLPKYACA